VAGECTERAFVSGLLIQKLRIQKGARWAFCTFRPRGVWSKPCYISADQKLDSQCLYSLWIRCLGWKSPGQQISWGCHFRWIVEGGGGALMSASGLCQPQGLLKRSLLTCPVISPPVSPIWLRLRTDGRLWCGNRIWFCKLEDLEKTLTTESLLLHDIQLVHDIWMTIFSVTIEYSMYFKYAYLSYSFFTYFTTQYVSENSNKNSFAMSGTPWNKICVCCLSH
jgi:hypothetical protein